MKLECITEASRLAQLRDPWHDLVEASSARSVFLTWEWLFTWLGHCGGGAALETLALWRGRKLAALLPLVRLPQSLGGWLRVPSLRFLGVGSVGSDDLDMLAREDVEEEAARLFALRLADERAVLRLDRLRAGASSARLLARELQRRGWEAIRTTTEVCPGIDLRGLTFEGYLASLGGEHRAQVRRKLKAARSRFELRFEEARSEESRREALAILIDFNLARWSGRGGSTAFDSLALREFHEEFTQHALGRGWLRLFVLRLDRRPAAAFYGLRYGDTFSFYQAGFEAALSKHSPGLVTMALAIRRAIDEGASRFDMLHGDEPYKRHWAREVRSLERLELYPPQVRARLWRSAFAFGRSARDVAQRVLSPRLARFPGGLLGEAKRT